MATPYVATSAHHHHATELVAQHLVLLQAADKVNRGDLTPAIVAIAERLDVLIPFSQQALLRLASIVVPTGAPNKR